MNNLLVYIQKKFITGVYLQEPTKVLFFLYVIIISTPMFAQVQLSKVGLDVDRHFTEMEWFFQNETGELQYVLQNEYGFEQISNFNFP